MHNASHVLDTQGRGSNSIAVRPTWIIERCDEILQGIVPRSKTKLTCRTERGKSFGVDRQSATDFLREYTHENGKGYGDENRCPLDRTHYADSLSLSPRRTPDKCKSNNHD